MQRLLPTRPLAAAVLALSLLGGVVATSTPAAACPNCRDTLPDGEENGEPTEKVAQGYAWSIGLMLLVPFTLVTIAGIGIYRVSRKANAKTG